MKRKNFDSKKSEKESIEYNFKCRHYLSEGEKNLNFSCGLSRLGYSYSPSYVRNRYGCIIYCNFEMIDDGMKAFNANDGNWLTMTENEFRNRIEFVLEFTTSTIFNIIEIRLSFNELKNILSDKIDIDTVKTEDLLFVANDLKGTLIIWPRLKVVLTLRDLIELNLQKTR